jgi:hypothetical protein
VKAPPRDEAACSLPDSHNVYYGTIRDGKRRRRASLAWRVVSANGRNDLNSLASRHASIVARSRLGADGVDDISPAWFG